jgi:hypothetical protein
MDPTERRGEQSIPALFSFESTVFPYLSIYTYYRSTELISAATSSILDEIEWQGDITLERWQVGPDTRSTHVLRNGEHIET